MAHTTEKASRSEEHTSELQSPCNLVCRLLLEKKRSAGETSSVPKLQPARCGADLQVCAGPPGPALRATVQAVGDVGRRTGVLLFFTVVVSPDSLLLPPVAAPRI